MQKTVSSRELDRKTGAIKKAARADPIFITEQGRHSHVLITIEAYRALLANDAGLGLQKQASGLRAEP
jgi:PHD/YefM family antitoxin component YafN of YafNO toxin-antitoxin module